MKRFFATSEDQEYCAPGKRRERQQQQVTGGDNTEDRLQPVLGTSPPLQPALDP